MNSSSRALLFLSTPESKQKVHKMKENSNSSENVFCLSHSRREKQVPFDFSRMLW
jgi:hypothetical protein